MNKDFHYECYQVSTRMRMHKEEWLAYKTPEGASFVRDSRSSTHHITLLYAKLSWM